MSARNYLKTKGVPEDYMQEIVEIIHHVDRYHPNLNVRDVSRELVTRDYERQGRIYMESYPYIQHLINKVENYYSPKIWKIYRFLYLTGYNPLKFYNRFTHHLVVTLRKSTVQKIKKEMDLLGDTPIDNFLKDQYLRYPQVASLFIQRNIHLEPYWMPIPDEFFQVFS